MTVRDPRAARLLPVVVVVLVVIGVLMLDACSIREPDYSGKQCPCPDGWSCNTATNHCVLDLGGGDAGTRDASPPTDASQLGDSCLPSPRGNLLYASLGFPDFPQGWLQGQGQWSLTGGVLAQTNSANALAYLARAIPTTNGGANYRIAATMRDIDTTGQGSIGIAFRISGTAMYLCTYSALREVLEIRMAQNQLPLTLQMGSAALPDPRAAFTMEINATGGQLSCCLRVPGTPVLTVQNNMLGSGNAGIAALESEAQFTAFFAYE